MSEMSNVSIKREGNILILSIDLDKDTGESTTSGSGVVIARTGGYLTLEDAENGGELGRVSLHMWRKHPTIAKTPRKFTL